MSENLYGGTNHDVGHGVTYRTMRARPRHAKGAPQEVKKWTDGGMTLVGLTVYHSNILGKVCTAVIGFTEHPDASEDEPSPVWTLESQDPITVTPEIRCERPDCLLRGSTTEGRPTCRCGAAGSSAAGWELAGRVAVRMDGHALAIASTPTARKSSDTTHPPVAQTDPRIPQSVG
jgi:hypothetical protein